MDIITFGQTMQLGKKIDDINEELGLNDDPVSYGTGNPLIINASIDTEIDLTFTTATQYIKSGRNLSSTRNASFTQFQSYNLPFTFPAGTYTFSALVTSTDTSSIYSAVILSDGTNLVTNIADGYIKRNERKKVTFTASGPFNKLYLYASNDYVAGAGDTATFSDIMLEFGDTGHSFEEYKGIVTSLSGATTKQITTNTYPTVVFVDSGTVHAESKETKVEKLSHAVAEVQNEMTHSKWKLVELVLTTGIFYLPDGMESTFANAMSSNVIPVTPGQHLMVTSNTQLNVPGIIFFDTNIPSTTSFVSYDCYTGSTQTYTDAEIIVPNGASYCVVQGRTDGNVILKKYDTKLRYIEETQYLESVMCNRLMGIGKQSGFSWGQYPKMILTIRVDDLRADIDKVAKIIMSDYGFPLVVAACVNEIDKIATGITDPLERIGNTRLDVLKWVQTHGGEVVVHPDETVVSGDYETSIKPFFIDSKRTFEENGIHIRGTAVANATPNSTLKAKLDPYLWGYYDYSDKYGSVAPYDGITTYMIVNFSSDASAFESWLDTKIASQTPVWVTLVMHQLGDDVTEQALEDMLDIIQSKVTNGDIVLKLWSDVYDTYSSFGN